MFDIMQLFIIVSGTLILTLSIDFDPVHLKRIQREIIIICILYIIGCDNTLPGTQLCKVYANFRSVSRAKSPGGVKYNGTK